MQPLVSSRPDRKSTRLNSSHTVIYTLSLHDALPIYRLLAHVDDEADLRHRRQPLRILVGQVDAAVGLFAARSEEHTSELQSHRDLHSFPTRRSSDLSATRARRRRSRPSPPTPAFAHPSWSGGCSRWSLRG